MLKTNFFPVYCNSVLEDFIMYTKYNNFNFMQLNLLTLWLPSLYFVCLSVWAEKFLYKIIIIDCIRFSYTINNAIINKTLNVSKVKRYCKLYHEENTEQFCREMVRKLIKQIAAFCGICERQPFLCLLCFNKAHYYFFCKKYLAHSWYNL